MPCWQTRFPTSEMKNNDTSTPIPGSKHEAGVSGNQRDVLSTIGSTEGIELPLDSSRDKTHGLRRVNRQIAVAYLTWGLVFLTAPLPVYILTHNLIPREFGIYSLFAILIRFLRRFVVMASHIYLTRKRSEIGSVAIEEVYCERCQVHTPFRGGRNSGFDLLCRDGWFRKRGFSG